MPDQRRIGLGAGTRECGTCRRPAGRVCGTFGHGRGAPWRVAVRKRSMSDTDETRRPKTLSLKKTETSTVKQSFSHGRTKAVVVEKKRTLGAPALAKPAKDKPVTAEKPAAVAASAEIKPAIVLKPAARGVVLR